MHNDAIFLGVPGQTNSETACEGGGGGGGSVVGSEFNEVVLHLYKIKFHTVEF